MAQRGGGNREVEKVETQNYFSAVEIFAEVRLKWVTAVFAMATFGFTVLGSYGLLLLHAMRMIELPARAIDMVSYTVPFQVLTVMGMVFKSLWERKKK